MASTRPRVARIQLSQLVRFGALTSYRGSGGVVRGSAALSTRSPDSVLGR